MLNLFQHLTASLFLSFSAHRSWNEFRMTVCVGLYMLVVWKTCGCGGLVALSPRMRCRSASLQTPFLFFVFCFHGLKSPRLLAFGFASFRRTSLSFCFLGHVFCVAFVFGSVFFQTPCLCNVMLNLFQHLTASLSLPFSADRSWNEFRMTVYGWLWGFGGLNSSEALPFRVFQTPCLCVLDGWVDLICALFKV